MPNMSTFNATLIKLVDVTIWTLISNAQIVKHKTLLQKSGML